MTRGSYTDKFQLGMKKGERRMIAEAAAHRGETSTEFARRILFGAAEVALLEKAEGAL